MCHVFYVSFRSWIQMNSLGIWVFWWYLLFVHVSLLYIDPAVPKIHKLYHQNVSILIMTRRESVKTRQVVRETWAHDIANYHFFVGRRICKTSGRRMTYCDTEHEAALIRDEIERYDDLRVLQMADTYRNLPTKMRLMLRWAVMHTNSKWFLKIDDDMFVMPRALNNVLLQYDAEATILGCIRKNAVVEREGKWGELYYRKSHYPTFALGSCGYVLSRDIAEFVTTRNDWFRYQGEDTSLGIWLNESNFHTKFVQVDLMNNNFRFSKCKTLPVLRKYFGKYVTWGHNVTYQDMKTCYQTFITERWATEKFKQDFVHSMKEKKWLDAQLGAYDTVLNSLSLDLLIHSNHYRVF